MQTASRCAVCEKTSDVVVWVENGYEGRACSCGTVYTTPAPGPGVVDFSYDGHPSCFYSAYADLKARWVSSVKPRGRLLEIGCGEGYFLRAARAAGYAVAGVDANPERAGQVSQSLGVEVRSGLFEELQFTHTYDVVYHCDLLSHFPDPVAALKKMSSMLNPGGILAFEVGTLGGVHPLWYRWIGLLGYPQHRWLYSERSLQMLLDQAGLRLVRLRHFGCAPSVLYCRSMVLLARLARSVLRPPARQKRSERATGWNGSIFDQVEQFFRYRVGALAPRIGPGTLFVAACPRGASCRGGL
jgi:SAM-dependent methyltransferase